MSAHSYVHPDPVVTGSLYCSGALDQALLALVPFRAFLRELGDDELPYLWCVRYARGGEHLKVRVHGPADVEAAVRERLGKTAEDFLAALGPRPEGVERRVRQDAFPIDREDRLDEGPPDRSFLFTHYEKSHVSLGGQPFLGDEGYRARMTACLARGCDQVLLALADQGQPLSHGQRQRVVFRAVLTGLAALSLPPSQAAAYLAYHRDWLIRFPLLRDGSGEERANGLLADLDRKAGAAEQTVTALRGVAEQLWRDPVAARESGWGRALAGLRQYVAGLCSEPDDRLDPFAEDPTFNPIFKALHGLANHLGLKWVDEAYAYHLLLRAAAPGESRYQRISLTPPDSAVQAGH
jgi:hypothetical protein